MIGFKSRMNQHVSDSRTRVSTCKFPTHVYKCGLKNECLNQLFFETSVMMKRKRSNQLETYEKNNNINLMSYSCIQKYFSVESYSLQSNAKSLSVKTGLYIYIYI